VHARDTFWREKYGDHLGRRPAPPTTPAAREHVHLPSPSHYPVALALGTIVAAAGALVSVWVVLLGVAAAVIGVYRFALEHHANPAHARQEGATGVDHRKIAMWTFLGSECMFFGTLIATYLAYKGRSVVGPAPREILNIPVTSASTFVLLMSSLLMVLALAAVGRGDRGYGRLWLFGTAFFGLIFLGFQAYEFTSFVHEGLTLQQNLFGSTFFVLTGFHGGHVALGVLWLCTLAILSLRGRLAATDTVKVEIAGLYWHFVDIVWIAIFTLVYLIP
jgi:heme/copper-type cytochrome/quinol oxidase subunit 3